MATDWSGSTPWDPGTPGDTPPPAGGGQGGDAFMAAAVVADALIQSNQNKKNRQAARDLSAYQYSKDLEMWHLQNQYNSPEETMRRLKMAGLNPNLIYGKGSDAGGTAREMPKYQAPRPDYTHKVAQLAPLMAMYQSFQKSQAEIDNVKTKTQLDQVKTMTESSKAVSGKARAQMDSELAKYSTNIARANYLKSAREAQNELTRGTKMHEDMTLTRQKFETEKQTTRYKRKEAELAEKYNMRMGDALQMRIAIKIADMLGFPLNF